MNKANITAFSDKDEFYDRTFSDLNCSSLEIKNKTFENCRFINANFTEVKFLSCKFVDCQFTLCNLSATQFDNSSFNEVAFCESKLIGINWTKLKWPCIKLTGPFRFYKSNLSHSSFYGLDFKETIIEECKAHDVDFREADLTGANFTLTDLERSQFMHTILYAADFTDAIHYLINPNENDIRKATFTLPDAINLLHNFDINIKEI